MKVLSISTDRNIFKEGSAVRARMIEYGELFDELHIVIFSQANGGFKAEQISSRVWVHPTNSWSRFFYVRNAIVLGSKIIKEKKFDAARDVITVQDPFETGLVGKALFETFKIPLQVQIHTDFLSPYFVKNSLLNRYRLSIARKVLPTAQSIRVVSNRIKKSLVEWGIKLTTVPTVLPIFVDIKKLEEAPVQTNLQEKYPQFNFIMLMASRLTVEKDIPTALRALETIVKKYPRAGLIIVGEGKEEGPLKNLVNNLGLKKNVVFEKWTSDLSSYYKTAHLFLLSSLFEGYSMTIVEALACHSPVIATDVGIASELLKNGDISLVCPVRDHACFASLILRFIEDNAFREQAAHLGRSHLDAVTFKSKDEYLRAYKQGILQTLQK